MSLLSRLFPKLPGGTEADHKEGGQGQSSDSRGAVAESGANETLLSAIRHLPDGEELRNAAGLLGGNAATDHAPMPASQRAAQERLAQLIDDGAVSIAELGNASAPIHILLGIATSCKEGHALQIILSQIKDPATLTNLAVEGSSSRIRQAAAEAVIDPHQLRSLLKQVRHKDKSVYKIIKHKCDALNAAERAAQDWETEVNAACESIERHSRRYYDALYKPSLDLMIARWNAISPRPTKDLELRVGQALERCREVIAAHDRAVADQAAREHAEKVAREHRESVLASEALEARRSAESQAQRDKEIEAARHAEESALAARRERHDQQLRQIAGMMRRAQAELRDGHTQRAAGIRRAIDERMSDAVTLPQSLNRQLQQLDAQLADFKAWKEHAVAPKRAELIAQMEALAGSADAPEQVAERIKALREEWRLLNQGVMTETGADWERFNRAAEAAYAPCREYFAIRAAERADNLEKRRALLERVIAFEGRQTEENTDWRLMARVLREAPTEWRRYFPVERGANGPLQGQFDEALGRLHARLEVWYEHNVKDKQALIKRARHLLSLDDSREAIEGAKKLQMQWKDTAPAPREKEQSLWGEFREVCDAIYQKRQRAFAEQDAVLVATQNRAESLCEQIEALGQLSGPELIRSNAKADELKAEFDTLGDLPRTQGPAVRSRFSRALRAFHDRVTRQHVMDGEQAVQSLFEACAHVHAYEAAIANGAPEDTTNRLKLTAETFIGGVQRWPKGGLAAIRERFALAAPGMPSDRPANKKALTLLCVRAEILCESSTPEEDADLRREYQVHRLMQAMSQGNPSPPLEWETLALEWVRVGPVEAGVYRPMHDRFLACWQRRG